MTVVFYYKLLCVHILLLLNWVDIFVRKNKKRGLKFGT